MISNMGGNLVGTKKQRCIPRAHQNCKENDKQR